MRLFFVTLCFILTSLSIQAQKTDRTNFRGGINGGLVVGDFSEAFGLTLGVDLYQHWGVSKEIDLGIATGFVNAFGEKESSTVGGVTVESEFDNVQFIPVAGSLRIYPTSGFKIGADVGYGIGLNAGNTGGFYYRPSIGVDVSGGSTELNLSYFAVKDETTFSAVLLGFLFLF